MSQIREAFDKWLDSDASATMTARSKFYAPHVQCLGSLSWHNGIDWFRDECIKKIEDEIAHSLKGSPDVYGEQCYRRALREAIIIMKGIQ